MSDSNTIKVDVDAGAALAVLRPLQVASDLIAAAAGRTVTVEQSIALLHEAREWIALGLGKGVR